MLARSVLCAAGGLGLAAAFPPYDVGPLAFVSLAPLLYVWRGTTPRRAAWYGMVFGLVFFGVLLEWSRYFGAVAIAPLVLGEAAFIAGLGALVVLMERRGVRSVWLVAAAWVAVEALRARFPFGGLPWGEVGVALHDLAPARALASVGGVALVSFVVVACNVFVVDAAVAMCCRAPRGVVLAAVGLTALVGSAFIADVTRFEGQVTGTIRFALLQGNDQDRTLTPKEIAHQYLTRRHLALARKLQGHYDLIVFPESALEHDPEQDPQLRAELVGIAKAHGGVVVANTRADAADGGVLNANVAYNGNGHLQGLYAKQHLVPFGEYVPFRDQLSFIGELQQVPYDYEPGHRRVLFRAAHHPFATVICFESAFAPLVRNDVRDGAQFIVVTTNNRSYRRSGLAAQHLAMSQMRAAETARAVVDPDGSVHDTSRLFVNKVTTGTIPAVTGETLYVRLGDWVVALSALALLGAGAWSVWRTRRSPVQSPS
jgi:apolipoprotein N-acyltransferase